MDVSLPKLLLDGYFDIGLFLGGTQVTTPPVYVKPCVNTVALNLGLVVPAGNIEYLDDIEYNVSDDYIRVSLPQV